MLDKANMTMLTDFYEITMANGYFEAGKKDSIAYFDVFFRSVPDDGGFAIFAGLEQIVEYLHDLKFTEEDLELLRSKNCFSEGFLDYLKNFEFECDVWSIPEGTPIFPMEPIITIKGPVIQAQFVETMVLLLVNHQSLIATKANRIVRAAGGRAVMEFGSRRAHGVSAAVDGARAAYIAGCVGTACTISDRKYGVPALGTMAHSWVQMFPSEYDAFKTYAEQYPDNCVLLVDTYNVLKSGLPNAIKVFKEVKPKKMGIRIDSGDVTYLTRQARKILDDAGLEECSIAVSNSLDEYLIRDVIAEGACIDSFGVGERLITSKSSPVFGGVYKLCAVEEDGEIKPKMKISENVGKITNPGVKKVYRLYDNISGKPLADLITLASEDEPDGEEIELFDPNAPWKVKKAINYRAENLRVKVFEKGKLIYDMPSLDEIQKHCKESVESMWNEMKRFENPQVYYVDLSKQLWNLRLKLIEEHSKQI